MIIKDGGIFMRKFLFSVLLIGVFVSTAFGAVSSNMRIYILSSKINMLYYKIDVFQTTVWGISIIGLLIAFAIFAPSLGEFLKNFRKPLLTVEDVKRLIAENNIVLRNSLQGNNIQN